jgi:polyhydroxyalkanoate synthesis regulator phasin
MSKKSSRPNFRQQQAKALVQQQVAKRAAETEQDEAEKKVKEFLTELIQKYVSVQAQLQRLAPAFADRCWRVHELYQDVKAQWARAEAAEERVRELTTRVRELELAETRRLTSQPLVNGGVHLDYDPTDEPLLHDHVGEEDNDEEPATA